MLAWRRKTGVACTLLLLVLSMILGACGTNNGEGMQDPVAQPAEQPGQATVDTTGADSGNDDGVAGDHDDASSGTEADSYMQRALAGEYSGTTVTMFGPFADADEVKFNESIRNFQDKTGITIAYEGSKEFEATIAVRINGGNAPDIADFPQPGLLKTFVAAGHVTDVRTFLSDEDLNRQYNESWLDMATMDGPDGEIMAGVWNRSSVKSLVWYPKKAFEEAGYTVPTTWEELLDLTEQIAIDGDPAWSIGIESGAATGWPATDWVEDFMLRTTSAENYDRWVEGELPFTDDIVKNAVSHMSEIWFNEEYVYGGRRSIVSTASSDAADPLFTDPPQAWLHRQANFITSNFPEDAVAGVDYDFFPLPPIDPQYGLPALIAGDIYVMLNDRPEVRAVMEFFTTGESIEAWVRSGGVIAPMNGVDESWYSSDVERRMAAFLQNADTIRFDGSDLMPGSVGAGTFWKGMTDYVSGTVDLDTAMAEIQAGWQ